MIRGRVLVIEADEGAGKGLVRALEESGHAVDLCGEAVVGFRKACETVPDCIVVSPELPDIDGAWVARRIRTEAGAISKVPIVFVGELHDRSVRTQTLNVGADVFLARPLSDEEIVAQIDAIISMARRIGNRGDADGPPSSMSFSAAIRGDLSAFPLASMLMMFEMERRSGLLEVVSLSGNRCTLTLSTGMFARTSLGGAERPALEVLRETLGWRAGRFSFQPRESATLPPPRVPVGALVLEAMRLEDEEIGPLPELSADELIDADSIRGEDLARSRSDEVAVRTEGPRRSRPDDVL
ncbi:MAG TPA: response regulator [Labilithrix sp.]|nr:response regulator [Labilithrix sp.]